MKELEIVEIITKRRWIVEGIYIFNGLVDSGYVRWSYKPRKPIVLKFIEPSLLAVYRNGEPYFSVPYKCSYSLLTVRRKDMIPEKNRLKLHLFYTIAAQDENTVWIITQEDIRKYGEPLCIKLIAEA